MNISSFQLVRTNPLLTTNLKLVVDLDYNLYLESFNANKQLADDKYKHFMIKADEKFEDKVVKFYDGLQVEHAYSKRALDDSTVVYNNYVDQYETTYWSGSKQIEDQWYTEEFEYFAPLYIEPTNIPEAFIILRVDDALIQENNKISSLNKSNFQNEIIDKWKCVNMFDLTEKTNLGKYLNYNYASNKNFPQSSFYLDNRELSFSKWCGIDYKNGKYTEKSLFLKDVLNLGQPHFKLEDYITSGFKKNNIIYPKILNLKYLYNDNPSTPYEERKYSINRYYGFYANKLKLISNLTSYDFPTIKEGISINNNVFVDTNNDPIYPFVEEWDKCNHYIYALNNAYEVKKLSTSQEEYYKIISNKSISYSDITYKNIVDINFTEENNSYINKVEGRNEKLIVDKFINSKGDITGLAGDLYVIDINNKYHVLKCKETTIDSSIYDCIYPEAYSTYKDNDNYIFKIMKYNVAISDRFEIIDKKTKDVVFSTIGNNTITMSNIIDSTYANDTELFVSSEFNLNRKSLVNEEFKLNVNQTVYLNKLFNIPNPTSKDAITYKVRNILETSDNYHFILNVNVTRGSYNESVYNRDSLFKINKETLNKLFSYSERNLNCYMMIIGDGYTGDIPVRPEEYNTIVSKIDKYGNPEYYLVISPENTKDNYEDGSKNIMLRQSVNTKDNIYLLVCKYTETENGITHEDTLNVIVNDQYSLVEIDYLKNILDAEFGTYIIKDLVCNDNALFIATDKGLVVVDEKEQKIKYINKSKRDYKNSDDITKLYYKDNKVYMVAQESMKYYLYIMDLVENEVSTSLYITFEKDQISWFNKFNYFIGNFVIDNDKMYSSLFDNSIDIVTSNNYINFNYYINTDYAINSNKKSLEYWTNNKENYSSKEFENGPILYPIYKINFSDIKDFDFERVETQYAKFENELAEYVNTDEHKLHTLEYRDKSIDKNFKYYSIDSKNSNKLMNVSSEYIADDELFEVDKNNNLSKIWTKIPDICKWAYNGSKDQSDYPYKLNNSLKVGSYYNRSTDIFKRDSDIISKNLDYFYRIGEFMKNNSKISYVNQTLNIETQEMYDDSKKFNLGNYVSSDFDYFEYFFNNKMIHLSDNNEEGIIKTEKYALFKNGDIYNSSQAIFKGLNFEISSISNVSINNEKVLKVSRDRKEFNNYKFSMIINDIKSSNDTFIIPTDGIYYKFYNELKLNSNLVGSDLKSIGYLESPSIINPIIYDNSYLTKIPLEKKVNKNLKLKKVKEFKLENFNNYYLKIGADVNPTMTGTTKTVIEFILNNVFENNNSIIKNDIYGKSRKFYKENLYNNFQEKIDTLYSFANVKYDLNPSKVKYISLEGIDKSILMNYKRLTQRADIINNLYEPIDSDSSLDNNFDYIEEDKNGIHIFLNKKYKNVLIVLNYKFPENFSLTNTDLFNVIGGKSEFKTGQERNNIYYFDGSEKYMKDIKLICANNFINAVNDINNDFGFDQYVTYHYIDENGEYGRAKANEFNQKTTLSTITSWKKNFPPYLLNVNLPVVLNTKKHSYEVTPIQGPYKTDYAARLISKDLNRNTYNRIYRYNGGYEPIYKNISIFDNLDYVNTNSFNSSFYPSIISQLKDNEALWLNELNTDEDLDERLGNNQKYLYCNFKSPSDGQDEYSSSNTLKVSTKMDIPSYAEIKGIEIYINTNFGKEKIQNVPIADLLTIEMMDFTFSDKTYPVIIDKLNQYLPNGTPNKDNVLFNNGNKGIYQYGDPVNSSIFSLAADPTPLLTSGCKDLNMSFVVRKINPSTNFGNKKLIISSLSVKIYYAIPFLDTNTKNVNIIEPNSYFNTDFEDFGIIKELMYSKVNENNTLFKNKQYQASYPMIDFCGYSYADIFIFKSTWDSEYYTQTSSEIKKLNV